MDKAERKRLKQQGKEFAERRSQELQAEIRAENPWPAGSPQWVARYKELNRLQQEGVARRKKLYPIPAWAVHERIISHVFVSLDSEAIRYDGSANQFAERATFSRITPFELTGLWAIMRDIEWNEPLVDGFEWIFQADNGRILIHRMPATMVIDLARLAPDQIEPLVPKWADREQFRWRREATRRVIEDLVRLAGRATGSGQNLYLWICF